LEVANPDVARRDRGLVLVDIDIDGFIALYRARIDRYEEALNSGHAGERELRDTIVFRLGYREAFEVLTRYDPELSSIVQRSIPEEWGIDW
jgi:hypothetical protein